MESFTTGAVVTTGTQSPRQFQDLFEVIPFTFTVEEDSIAAEAASTADITVTGAALGDFVLIAPIVDVVSIGVHGWVQAANTVTVALTNMEVSDANTTLATVGTWRGLLLKPRKTWAQD
jgi:hypothetical protein